MRRACVTAPAVTPVAASCRAPGLRRAAMDSAKKVPPVSSMTVGVAAAAKPQPRYWNTKRPPTMSAIVAQPVAIETSASTPCSGSAQALHRSPAQHLGLEHRVMIGTGTIYSRWQSCQG